MKYIFFISILICSITLNAQTSNFCNSTGFSNQNSNLNRQAIKLIEMQIIHSDFDKNSAFNPTQLKIEKPTISHTNFKAKQQFKSSLGKLLFKYRTLFIVQINL